MFQKAKKNRKRGKIKKSEKQTNNAEERTMQKQTKQTPKSNAHN